MPAPAITASRSDTPVQLSAFEVTTESVRGYATTSSTSASRISVPVTELPSSLITINEQLIADTVATPPEEVLILVGKRPLATPRTKIGLMVGSYSFYKADLDTSGFVDQAHKLGYRLLASYRHTDGPNDHPADVNKRKGFFAINPSLRYRFDHGFEHWFWTGFIRDKTPRLRRITKTLEASNDDVAHPLYTVADDGGAHNVLTYLAQVKTDNYEVGATKTVTLFGVRADLRLLARHIEQLDSNVLINATGGADVFVDRAGAIIGTDDRIFDFSRVADDKLAGFFRTQAQVSGRADTTESDTYATDVSLAFKLGPTQHKLLISGSINEAQRESRPGVDGRTYQIPSADVLQRLGAERVGTTSRIWLYPISRNVFAGIDPSTIIANANSSSVQSETFQDSTRSGLGFNERMSTFGDRLFLTAGARYTHTEITTQTGTAAASRNATSDWSNSFTALVKAYKGEKGEVSLDANTKSTFIPVFTIDRRLATFGEKYPNRTAKENELGLKFDLHGSRFVATPAVFDKLEDNALVNDLDEDGSVTGTVGRTYQSRSASGRPRAGTWIFLPISPAASTSCSPPDTCARPRPTARRATVAPPTPGRDSRVTRCKPGRSNLPHRSGNTRGGAPAG